MYFIGLDLGKRVDFSADAVVERIEGTVGGFDPVTWSRTAQTLPDEWVAL